MAEPLFLIQIVHVGSDVVAKMPGGGRLEADFVDAIVSHLKKYPSGYFTSQSQVEENVKQAVVDTIATLKAQAHKAL